MRATETRRSGGHWPWWCGGDQAKWWNREKIQSSEMQRTKWWSLARSRLHQQHHHHHRRARHHHYGGERRP
ncbi:hypothetical protein Bca4012_099144 [Brassica carinata]|uniref:Uncharacterized protein n=1 Tax=Brassica oleracea TaxID=3712 RepID=A0A3P6G8Q1_BRAOL|nr:unnamed protein product [Brassica oleracea]